LTDWSVIMALEPWWQEFFVCWTISGNSTGTTAVGLEVSSRADWMVWTDVRCCVE